jgi:hypothetical protein
LPPLRSRQPRSRPRWCGSARGIRR